MSSGLANVALVVPVKDFSLAKGRLAEHIDAQTRTALATALAENVLAAAGEIPTFVACDSDEVAAWARTAGAEALQVSPNGLNEAVEDALGQLATRGFTHGIIAHSDLPLANTFDHLSDPEPNEMIIVPDRHRDGTNVMVTPLGTRPKLAYGPGSFLTHLHNGAAAGLSVTIIQDVRLGWDIDEPTDLDFSSVTVPGTVTLGLDFAP